jgi:hypothetical protein
VGSSCDKPSSQWTVCHAGLLEARIAGLAEAQHGVVAVSQLETLGLSASAARSRVTSRRLHRVHRGVFAVGRPGLTSEGIYMAATLATGGGLADGSAAHHLDLLPSPRTNPVHVVAPRQIRSRAGIAVRRGSAQLTNHRGIPTTTIDQTLIDLAASGRARDVERAIDRAEAIHRHDFGPLRARLRTSPRGAPLLRRLLAAPPARTRSELEEAFLALCRGASLPSPSVNLWIASANAEADFA